MGEKKKNLTLKEATQKYVGKSVKVVAKYGGHNTTVGTIIDVTTVMVSAGMVYLNGIHGYFWNDELQVSELTKEELEKSIKILQKEISEIESKLQYLKDSGADKFDETEFKVFSTLNIIEGTDSKIEKAKLIAKLING